jgi:hypothetical protein
MMAVTWWAINLAAAGKLRASRMMVVGALLEEIRLASKLGPINSDVPATKHYRLERACLWKEKSGGRFFIFR